MKELNEMSKEELLIEIVKLEQEIDLKIAKYNILAKELCKRSENVIEQSSFEPKIISKNTFKI